MCGATGLNELCMRSSFSQAVDSKAYVNGKDGL